MYVQVYLQVSCPVSLGSRHFRSYLIAFLFFLVGSASIIPVRFRKARKPQDKLPPPEDRSKVVIGKVGHRRLQCKRDVHHSKI